MSAIRCPKTLNPFALAFFTINRGRDFYFTFHEYVTQRTATLEKIRELNRQMAIFNRQRYEVDTHAMVSLKKFLIEEARLSHLENSLNDPIRKEFYIFQ